jgi:hypothetical protein
MRTDFARLAAILLSLGAGRAAVADWHVWTVTDTRHVLRSDPPGDERAAKVAAARNEWVSFQVLLRSDEPVNAVRVEAAELRGPNGAVLRPSESVRANDHSPLLYRQHQLPLEVGTYRNDAFKPDWYPDPLIPFEHPMPGRKLESARVRAIPFDLPANETHGFWVDLYVPPETTPGEYRGTYLVTAEDGKSLEVAVVLTVWDFELPQTPTLVMAFGSPAQRLRDFYRQRAKMGQEPEPSDWQAVQTQCAQLLSEHRFNAVPPSDMLRPVAQANGSFQIPAEQVRALRAFVDRYHVNALDIPHPSSVIKDPEAERDKLRAWLAAFDRAAQELNRPQIVFYVYLKDEPNTREGYEYVQKWGRAIRAAKSVVQVMVVEQTWTEPGLSGADSAWGDLYGAVDIWCPLFSLHRQDSAAKRQALGETVWAYTALCQGPPTPWWHIDYPLLNYRVPAWMAWRDGMKGLLYWGGMSYWRETDDPWLHAPVYTGRGVFQQGDKGIRFNGEGSLVYPARAVGYDGIVPTIRLKALRDAIEDYEYLAILSRLGKSVEADKIVRRLTESWFQWDKDPAAYEKARAELAAMIMRGARPSSAGDRTTPAAGGATLPAAGPLRVHPTNPRYFTDGTRNPDGSFKAVYLTGSHTWANLQDCAATPTSPPFDFAAYLDFLQERHHNFIRLWAWEGSYWVRPNGGRTTVGPLPFARTGPGLALDGQPKFDVTKFNQAYFDRLRERVLAARTRGFYVGVMLFQGFSVARKSKQRTDTPWTGHPLNAANNINGLDGDPDGDGNAYEVHTLAQGAITRVQEAYVRQVIDTVNDLDNVIYEISNESHGGSSAWQYHMIDFIHRYERTKPRQHPVWMSFCWDGIAGPGTMADLLASSAEAVSPPGNDKGHEAPRRYIEDPPADDTKVVISDTDHLWGIGGSRVWVWKSFVRGLYPIFMDTYRHSPFVPGPDLDPQWDEVRRAMGVTRRLAERVNLAAMTPHPELASTAYCLADPGREYLVYLPQGGEVTVDLSAVTGRLSAEWVHVVAGTVTSAESVAGGGQRTLKAPSSGEAVVHLRTVVRTGADGATEAAPYLAAVRQFADQVLAHGRDTYGKPTPLFVDGVNVDTLEPVKWKWADGKEWVLCNLASQQGLLRTLDGLSRLTGEPRYKEAALAALRYAFDHLRYGTENNGGLLAWGGHLVYNATDDVIAGNPDGSGRVHELKCFFPHYELMWEANPQVTRQLIENMWNGHVLNWSNLDFNRHAAPKKLGALWQNEYRGGDVFFDGKGLTFHNAGSDFYFAAGMLSKLAGTPEPLVWAKRLAHRYVETRDPKTGLGGYQFSQCRSAWCDDVGKIRGDRAQYQYGDDFPGHRVVEGTLFPCYGNTPEVEPQVGGLLLGDQLGEAGRDFTRWVVDELTAWGKSAYRKKDNAFIPMLTDGTSMEGYVCKKDGYFGPKGRVLRAGHPGPAHLWLYAWAFRQSRDAFLWEMARNIAQGNGWGDIGATPQAPPSLHFPNDSSDPFLLVALLEFHRVGGQAAFLERAQVIGQNLVKQRVQKGWFVRSRRHLFCQLGNHEAQALLHLAAALLGKPDSVPAFTGASPFFHARYNGQALRSYDTAIIYRKVRP